MTSLYYTSAINHQFELKTMEISATEFKAKCLKLMDEITKTHESITVTKHGKAVAKLVPIEPNENQSKTGFGCMAGTIEILGDIITPIEEPWSAITGDEDEYYQDTSDQKGNNRVGYNKDDK